VQAPLLTNRSATSSTGWGGPTASLMSGVSYPVVAGIGGAGMVVGHAVDPWRGIGRWAEGLAELHGRIVHRFAQSEVRERARRYQ
jgi:hypothetical protein